MNERLIRIETKIDHVTTQVSEFQGSRVATGNWVTRGAQVAMLILALGGIFVTYLEIKTDKQHTFFSDVR